MLNCRPAKLYSRNTCRQHQQHSMLKLQQGSLDPSTAPSTQQCNGQAQHEPCPAGCVWRPQRLPVAPLSSLTCTLCVPCSLEISAYTHATTLVLRHTCTCLLVATATPLLPAATTSASSPAGSATVHSFSPHHDSNARYICSSTNNNTNSKQPHQLHVHTALHYLQLSVVRHKLQLCCCIASCSGTRCA